MNDIGVTASQREEYPRSGLTVVDDDLDWDGMRDGPLSTQALEHFLVQFPKLPEAGPKGSQVLHTGRGRGRGRGITAASSTDQRPGIWGAKGEGSKVGEGMKTWVSGGWVFSGVG